MCRKDEASGQDLSAWCRSDGLRAKGNASPLPVRNDLLWCWWQENAELGFADHGNGQAGKTARGERARICGNEKTSEKGWKESEAGEAHDVDWGMWICKRNRRFIKALKIQDILVCESKNVNLFWQTWLQHHWPLEAQSEIGVPLWGWCFTSPGEPTHLCYYLEPIDVSSTYVFRHYKKNMP